MTEIVTSRKTSVYSRDSPVISEMILPTESLAANVAGVGPLVRVRSLVDEEVVALGELAVTELADELLLRPRGPTRPRR